MSPKEPPLVSEPRPVRRGDNTGQIRHVARQEAQSFASGLEKKVKHLKFWFSLIIMVAGAGFAAASYLNRDARRIDALEIKMDFVVEQLQEIARHTGSREVMKK